MRSISAAELKRLIGTGSGLAILDAREEGEFGGSHLFWAVPCPLSRKELRARALLPKRGIPVVCVDGGEGYAATLAEYLRGIGCTDVAVLEGGNAAWEEAGFPLFSGVHVPSKAFGEWVEHHYGTESLDPPELDALVKSGVKHVILDSRPMDEFAKMTIPGALNVPGGELAYRIGDLVPDAETTIVVNCAGRTRSIMGAESLRRAGVPNRVVALRNGTMGWELAGFSCERGVSRSFAPGTPGTAKEALARATRFGEEHGVRTVSRAEAERLLAAQDRTTYTLDVRTAEEYEAGHIPGFRHAPGGQLVQATDQWVAARGARVILADNDTVRARMSGAWLRQMGGWEVLVVEGALDGPLETGPWRPEVPELRRAATVTPAELAALGDTVQVVDLARSIDFRASHIPGSRWAVRGRVPPFAKPVVVTAPDETLAHLAAAEIPGGRVLAGGLKAWKAEGRPVAADRHQPEDEDCVDWYLRPYDRNSGQEAAMHEYLRWEIDLVNGVARDGDARFGAW
ncbi:rhodanese-like domain-containing protein [Sabulicella glaciei]|uniref:Rhodanese-like domain-containing protein n=1 Tax=Sabulicella glaciei TaxID=2984948 RepID=A0ABT3NUH8_9PROT|nr:rhodanese-like domain-containing protein [Roseococcus sp. MDT2-1-1]MCW8085209.1 rhodanese-like domain-containing protein [Roseococcus sp. MDT2-1-1]